METEPLPSALHTLPNPPHPLHPSISIITTTYPPSNSNPPSKRTQLPKIPHHHHYHHHNPSQSQSQQPSKPSYRIPFPYLPRFRMPIGPKGARLMLVRVTQVRDRPMGFSTTPRKKWGGMWEVVGGGFCVDGGGLFVIFCFVLMDLEEECWGG